MRFLSLAIVMLLVAGAPAAQPAKPALAVRATPASEAWVWPVSGPRVVLRAFVAPSSAYGPGHRGVDMSAREHGVAVVAVMSGVVHFAGVVVDRPVITVRQGQVLATVEPVEPLVAAGDVVEAGDIIGVLQPGHCARACVHLGVRVAGEYVSPLLWLGGLQRAVLLPMSGRPA
jgi:murein DD-endopeptidase MepM/ murein hydrolase activator NlpD